MLPQSTFNNIVSFILVNLINLDSERGNFKLFRLIH